MLTQHHTMHTMRSIQFEKLQLLNSVMNESKKKKKTFRLASPLSGYVCTEEVHTPQLLTATIKRKISWARPLKQMTTTTMTRNSRRPAVDPNKGLKTLNISVLVVEM